MSVFSFLYNFVEQNIDNQFCLKDVIFQTHILVNPLPNLQK